MRKFRGLLTFSLLLVALALPTTASAALGDLSLISRADGFAGVLGDGNSYVADRSISADGRYVVFASYAQNLGGPITAARNVYRRDTLLGRTELVSRATGLSGTAGDDVSFGAAVSANGDRIAFVSSADNLSSADNDSYTNIYVRDMAAGTTTLASRASGVSGAAALGGSLIPKISGNGNVVGFQSAATNLDPTITDNNTKIDAFVRDLTDSTTRLISRSTSNVLGTGFSSVGELSGDGNLVTIDTDATNLGGTIGAGTNNVYLRNRSAGTTTLVSQPSGNSNVGSDDEAGGSTITDSGDRIAFYSRASNLATDAPASRYEIYIRDLGSSTTTLASRSLLGAPADSDVDNSVISSDGSILTFESAATNLDGPTGAKKQAFVRDLSTGLTQVISRVGRTGAVADGDTYDVTPGRSSGLVVFDTSATNLIGEATGADYQLFIRDVKVVDPLPPITISGKKFKAKLSRKSFSVKATTSGGATAISGKATLKVSKRLVKSGKIVVKLKSLAVASTLTSHKLKFTLSKKQNKLVLKALKKKSSRVKVTVALNATGPGTPGYVSISGKLRR